MSPDDLKGLSYADKLKMASDFSGVPAAVFDKQYQVESGRGTSMLSPKGAAGHFQIMPATNATWNARLGRSLDPSNFDDSLTMAAYQMKENLSSTGSVADALRMYNAGPNRTHWNNKETTGYVDKILGPGVAHNEDVAAAPLSVNPALVLSNPMDLVYGHTAVSAATPDRSKPVQPTTKEINAAAVGGDAVASPTVSDASARLYAAKQGDARAMDGQLTLGTGSFGDKFSAGWQNTATAAVINMMDRGLNGANYDPDFGKWKSANLDQIRKDGKDQTGFETLVGARSQADYNTALAQLRQHESVDQGARYQGADRLVYGLGAGLSDPVGNLAFGSVGGLADAAGVGGKALLSAGRYGAGLAAYAGEGAASNIAVTGLMQAAGDHETLNDYLMAGVTGGMIGLAHGGFSLGDANKAKLTLDDNTRASLDAAMAEHGPAADPQQVIATAAKHQMAPGVSTLEEALYSEASDHTFMPREAEDAMLDPKSQKAASQANGTEFLADGAERNTTNEIIANGERIDASIPTNKKALTSLTSWLPDAQSSGMTMLKSENPLTRAIGKVLVESTTGAAGRRSNAAMVKYIHETRFHQAMAGWDELANHYIMYEGHGLLKDQVTQTGRKEFNRRVYMELLSREHGTSTETNETVLKAADKYQGAMQMLADTQRGAKTAGHLRLHESSEGYVPRRMKVSEVVDLRKNNLPGYRALVRVLTEQLTGTQAEGKFDPKFAEKVAEKYLGRQLDKWAGQGSISMQLHDSDATATLREAIKAMTPDASPEEVEKLLGRFSRGGGEWTKKRLDLNLMQSIPDGKGGSKLLLDYFDQDLTSLFRRQARRVSGEAALARHNILGMKGVTAVRDAIKESGGSIEDLKSYDHVMSEFMGQPIGDMARKRVPLIEDVLVATSGARLGMASINQLGDYGNALSTVGLARVAAAVAAIPRMLSEIRGMRAGKLSDNPILRDFDRTAFVGGEDYWSSGLFNSSLDDDFEMYGKDNLSTFGRISRIGAKAQYIASFHRAVVAMQTRGLAEQLLKKTFVMLKDGKSDVNLTDIGLGAEWQASVRSKLGDAAEFDSHGNLTALHINDTLSGDELLTLQTALHRGAGQMVQRTFIGETGSWVSNSMLKMLYQFRRVGIVAMEKQTARDLANKGLVGTFAGMLAGWAFGVPLQAARVELKSVGLSQQDRDKYLANNLSAPALGLAALNYATKSGLLADVTQIGTGFAAAASHNLLHNDAASNLYSAITGGSRAGTRDFVGGDVAPAVGVVNDFAKGLQGNPEKLLRLMPGANMIYMQPFLNAIHSASDQSQ